MRKIRVLVLAAVLMLGGCRAIAHALVDVAFDSLERDRSCEVPAVRYRR